MQSKEYIGSVPGTVILKVKKKKQGISIKAKGTPMELITVAASIVDEVGLVTHTSLEEVLAEILMLLKDEQ